MIHEAHSAHWMDRHIQLLSNCQRCPQSLHQGVPMFDKQAPIRNLPKMQWFLALNVSDVLSRLPDLLSYCLLSTAEADYAISVYPVIYEHSNPKKKHSDYVLIKIKNSYIQSVIELKKLVAYDSLYQSNYFRCYAKAKKCLFMSYL